MLLKSSIFKKIYLFSLLANLLISLPAVGQNNKTDSLKEVISQNSKDINHLEALIDLSYYYLRRNLDSALYYATSGTKLAKALDNERGIGIALTYQAIANMDLGKVDIAEKLIVEAIKVLENSPKKWDNSLAMSYSILGHLENNKENIDKAFEYYLKAAKLCENSTSSLAKSNIGVHYNNIAILFRNKNEHEKGLKYTREGLKSIQSGKQPLIESALLSSVGRFFGELHELDSALLYFNKALVLKEQVNDKIGKISLLSSIGHLHKSKKEYQKAEALFLEGLALAEATNYQTGIVLYHSNFASLYIASQQYDKAIFYAQKMVDAYENKNIGVDMSIENFYFYLAESYAAIGQFDEAYFYQKKYTTRQDTIAQQKQIERLDELEAKYQLEKKEQEKAAQAKLLKQQGMLLVIGGIFMIVITLVALFLYRLLHQRRVLMQSLQQKNEELKQLDKAKNRFFSNVSHELKTPLTLIISPLKQLLKSKKLDSDTAFLIKSAEKNSTQLFELTNQILELTRFEIQKEVTKNTTFDLAELAKTTCASFESLAANQHINFSYNYHGQTPLIIISDEYKIKTILKNLISNALKYTKPYGRIDVKIIEQAGTIQIAVEDNGQGIRAEDLPYIFDRFYQSKYEETLVKGGTGIGLAICREYAEALNGTIEVNSEWQKGSLFTLTFPKNMVNMSAKTNAIVPTATFNQTYYSSDTFQEHLSTILIVEDNLDMQAYIEFILKQHYNIIKTPHGKAALQVLNEMGTRIDLVISDLMMPVMDGYELMENIKKQPKLANIPTIMLTALNAMDNKIKALKIGINDYIAKPFEAEELLLRIEHLLQFKEERKNAIVSAIENVALEVKIEEEEEEIDIASSSFSETENQWLEELESICLKKIDHTSLTVKELAQDMAMSYTKFWRKLQELLGMSPSQYLQEIRFREARKYIEAQRYSTIKQVAYAVGFKDERNFSRNFKKRFGKYPSEYLE